MALSLDSFIQGTPPLSPGLPVPDNSQGLVSDMYSEYSYPGPLFEDTTGHKGDEDLAFLIGCEELPSLTDFPSTGFCLEEGWVGQLQFPLTPDEPNQVQFTSLSPVPPPPPPPSSEWFTQPTSLPLTPESQVGDVIFSSTSCSPTPTPTPYTTITSPVTVYTPDSSLPATPLSSSYDNSEQELNSFLALFEDGSCTNPIVLSSDPVSPSSSYGTPSPLSSTEEGSIRDLLLKSESPSPQPPSQQTCARTSMKTSTKAVGSRKRKSSSLDEDGDPSYQPCRPTTSKRRLPQSVKKEKKREQNKNAALRYRQRKKEEKSDVEVRRQELEEKNGELKQQVESLSNEINYLKKLWQEVLSAKKRKVQQQRS